MTLPSNVIYEKKKDIDNLDAISCSASQISNKDVMSDHLSSCVNSVVVREKSLNRPKRGTWE